MTLGDWTDTRDRRDWKLRQTGLPTVLMFASRDDFFSVLVDFSQHALYALGGIHLHATTWLGQNGRNGEGEEKNQSRNGR